MATGAVAVNDPAEPQPEAHGIVGLVVHKLHKERNRQAEIDLRPNAIEVNPTAIRLVEQLHKLYADRPQKSFGRFEDDHDNFPMGRLVTQYYVDQATSFYDISCAMMRHLEARANGEPLATGGYVVIAHVTNGATQWLLALIVTEVLGTAITEGLNIVDSVHLDMTNLRVAGRVNLTAWTAGAERYISFLKGKADVSNYFKLFLGCNTVLDNLVESQKFVDAIRTYASNELDDPEARGRLLDQVYEYMRDLGKRKEPVSLTAFANHFSPADPDLILRYLTTPDLELSDEFVPDGRAINALATWKYKTAGWELKFSRAGIRSQEVGYNPDNNTIILSNVPDALREILLEELPDSQENV